MGSWRSSSGGGPPPAPSGPHGYLEDPAEAEAGVHELNELQQELQGVDVALEAVPQVDVLHLHGRLQGGLATGARVPPAAPRGAPRTFTATTVPSCSLARCTWARLAAAMGW